ncbi:MAG: iron(III) transport system substrate-binding protein [Halobacteriales archaeon]|jgi:iron(III) transport system substrate-binding protein
MDDHDGPHRNDEWRSSLDRRRFLAGVGTAGVAATAGCLGEYLDDGGDTRQDVELFGSMRLPAESRGGTPMAALPALQGELTVYSGRHEWLVGDLLSYIEGQYDGFSIVPRYESSRNLANKILTAGSASEADVFFSVNAGTLGQLTSAGRTLQLTDAAQEMVPEAYRADDGGWTGVSGRARTVPYNTTAIDASEVPDSIDAFPEREAFENQMGWAPGYGSFQAFITAMRVLRGPEATRDWLEGMVDAGVQRYGNEQLVAQAVADGEISLGFANHYYVQRVLANDPDAPIATAFTKGDAGAIFNVAGAAIVDGVNDRDLAGNFVRHLLSAEAQEYFAVETFEYPLVPDVAPVGDLPPVDDLQPPTDLDLTTLSDLEPTLELMRDAGIMV